MALQWDKGGSPAGLIADRNLYLDETGTKLVPEAEAKFQLMNAGREIPAFEVESLGLYLDKNGKIAQKGQESPKSEEGASSTSTTPKKARAASPPKGAASKTAPAKKSSGKKKG